MRYKISKFCHLHLISNVNYFLSFILTFLIVLVAIFLNQTIINKANSSFCYISEYCAYYEEKDVTNINDCLKSYKEKYKELNVNKISYTYTTTQLINTGTTNEYFQMVYLDFDSNFLSYKKSEIYITFFSNDKNGIVVDEKTYQKIGSSQELTGIIDTTHEKYKLKIVGTYKTDDEIMNNHKMYGSYLCLEKQIDQKIISNSKYNIQIELQLNDKIDNKLNNTLKLYDSTCITRKTYVDAILVQFNEIMTYFNNILYVFYAINILSLIIILYKYFNFREDFYIYNIFYENKKKTLFKDILRCSNSFVLIFIGCIILYLIFNLFCVLSFKMNIDINITTYLYYFLICFIINIIFVIIFDLINNQKTIRT